MTQLSRRRFLEDSLLAAAAASLPALSSCSFSPPKKAGDLLQVAVVGAGGRGSQHVDAFLANPNTEIAYIVEVDEKIGHGYAEAVGKRQKKKPKFVRDLRQALDDKSLHIVSTATPNHWHALCAIWSMQAGKDVYVEKPVEPQRQRGTPHRPGRPQARARLPGGHSVPLDERDHRRHRVHQVGEDRRSEVARGLCYKPRKSIGPAGHYEIPPQVDYNLWAGPARMLPLTRPHFHYDWHWQREWGNGDMGNQGPHQMDIARWGLGLDRLADRVIAYGGRLGYEDAGDVANTEVALCEFGDKTIAFEVRGLPTDPLRGASVGNIFYGSEGYLVLTSYKGGAAFDPQGSVMKRFSGDGDHFGNFVDAVLARDPKLLHAEVLEGHLSHAHCHLANISYYLGKPASAGEIENALANWKTHEDAGDTLQRTLRHLADNHVDVSNTPLMLGPELTIDPMEETIVGNAAASAMLTREYRAPFVVPKAGEV